MNIENIIKSMTNCQKESIKRFYDVNKTGVKTCGSRAGRCMERKGLIKLETNIIDVLILKSYWNMYSITDLGIKVAEILLLDELKEKEDWYEKHPDWISAQDTLKSFKEKLTVYGIINA